MTPEQFAYWLQGFAELHGGTPTPAQWGSIMAHLRTVFDKVTPPLQTGPIPSGPIPRKNAIDEVIKEMERKQVEEQARRFPLGGPNQWPKGEKIIC